MCIYQAKVRLKPASCSGPDPNMFRNAPYLKNTPGAAMGERNIAPTVLLPCGCVACSVERHARSAMRRTLGMNDIKHKRLPVPPMIMWRRSPRIRMHTPSLHATHYHATVTYGCTRVVLYKQTCARLRARA